MSGLPLLYESVLLYFVGFLPIISLAILADASPGIVTAGDPKATTAQPLGHFASCGH